MKLKNIKTIVRNFFEEKNKTEDWIINEKDIDKDEVIVIEHYINDLCKDRYVFKITFYTDHLSFYIHNYTKQTYNFSQRIYTNKMCKKELLCVLNSTHKLFKLFQQYF